MVVGRNDGKNHDRGEKQEKGAIKQKKKKKKEGISERLPTHRILWASSSKLFLFLFKS